ELGALGCETHVAYLASGPNLARLESCNVSLHQLRAKNNHNPFILFELLRLIRKIKPDVVQTWVLQMDVLGGIAARLTRTPWIFREPTSETHYTGTPKQQLRVLLASGSRAIISNSQGGDQYWRIRYPNKPRYII